MSDASLVTPSTPPAADLHSPSLEPPHRVVFTNMTLDNRRTMHRCLQIPELLAIVFEMVYSEPDGPATAALLARTARIFEDTALDILWRAQNTLVPLLKCFPVDMWEVKRDEGIRKLVSACSTFQERGSGTRWHLFNDVATARGEIDVRGWVVRSMPR